MILVRSFLAFVLVNFFAVIASSDGERLVLLQLHPGRNDVEIFSGPFEIADAVSALPVFFRTMRGEKPTEEELINLIQLNKRR